VPLALLVYSAARAAERRGWAVLLGPAALLAAYPIHVPAFDASDYAFGVVLFGAAWAAGRLVRRLEAQRRLLADGLAAQLRAQAQLGELADGFRRAGLDVHVAVDGLPPGLPTALDVSAYRLLQEALTNVLKHSGATAAAVTVEGTGDAVVLEVTDRGPERA